MEMLRSRQHKIKIVNGNLLTVALLQHCCRISLGEVTGLQPWTRKLSSLTAQKSSNTREQAGADEDR